MIFVWPLIIGVFFIVSDFFGDSIWNLVLKGAGLACIVAFIINVIFIYFETEAFETRTAEFIQKLDEVREDSKTGAYASGYYDGMHGYDNTEKYAAIKFPAYASLVEFYKVGLSDGAAGRPKKTTCQDVVLVG